MVRQRHPPCMTAGRLLVYHKTGYCRIRSRPSQWILYTSVFRSVLYRFLLLLFLRLGSSGRPPNKLKPANDIYKSFPNQLQSYYWRSIASTVIDDCCRPGPRHLSQTYAGIYAAPDLEYSSERTIQVTGWYLRICSERSLMWILKAAFHQRSTNSLDRRIPPSR